MGKKTLGARRTLRSTHQTSIVHSPPVSAANALAALRLSTPPRKKRKERGKYERISAEKRKTIIDNIVDLGKRPIEIAKQFNLKPKSVYSILSVYKKENRVEKLKQGGERNTKVNDKVKEKIVNCIEKRNDFTLKQIVNHLENDEKSPIKLSTGTVYNALIKNEITNKKLIYVPAERNTPSNIQKRKDYCLWAITLDKRNIIFIDETGFNLHMKRGRGWSKKGTRAVIIQQANRGANISVLAAFSPVNGFIKHVEKMGAIHSDDYEKFVADLLKEVRFRHRSHTIIHDNARIHREKQLNDILHGQTLQHEIKFLPPYSPQLNPIETGFHIWKSAIRGAAMSERNTTIRLTNLINSTRSNISPTMSEHLYEHVVKYYCKCAAGEPLDEKYDPGSLANI